MTIRTITFDDEQWQVVPREPNEAMVRAGLEASLTANKYLAMLDAAPEPPASMLTQRKLMRAINALGIDSRAGTPDYVLSDAIWAYLHGIPAKSLPAQPRRPYGTDTMSEYGVIPECDAPEPPAQPEVPMRDLLAEAREQVEALDRENHRMRRCVARLMARLTVWLDDDQFNEADGIMTPEFEPPAQQPTEPAAYMYQHDETGRTTFREADDRMNERRWEEFPLYRHPASEQQPMTEEEIASLSETQVGTAQFLVAKLHVREAERHHGIGKGVDIPPSN